LQAYYAKEGVYYCPRCKPRHQRASGTDLPSDCVPLKNDRQLSSWSGTWTALDVCGRGTHCYRWPLIAQMWCCHERLLCSR